MVTWLKQRLGWDWVEPNWNEYQFEAPRFDALEQRLGKLERRQDTLLEILSEQFEALHQRANKQHDAVTLALLQIQRALTDMQIWPVAADTPATPRALTDITSCTKVIHEALR